MPDRPLETEVNDLMQRLIDINERWPGDYALIIQASCTAEDTCTSFSWYYKPPMAGASGDMATVAKRPPGYEDPAGDMEDPRDIPEAPGG